MFRSMLSSMDGDSFLGNHMRRMDQMMENMMMPSMLPNMPGHIGFPSINNNMNSLMSFPGFGQSLFPSVDQMFNNIQTMASDPNCHSYSSSSVMTYTMGGNGQPLIYEATSSTRSAPGGVKETRQTVRNSETGEHHMSIGHHINDKAHIIEKSNNVVTGQREETEEFINIEEDQAEEFNQEWVTKTQQNRRRNTQAIDDSEVEILEIPQPLAITNGASQPHTQRSHLHQRRRDRNDGEHHLSDRHRNRRSMNNRKSSKYLHLPRHESHM